MGPKKEKCGKVMGLDGIGGERIEQIKNWMKNTPAGNSEKMNSDKD